MIDTFEENVEISLGEDTIFTYLVLRYAKKIKALEFPNEYFYNIGNQSSMMKNDLIQNHMTKSKNAYNVMKKYLLEDGYSEDEAYALYFFLIESLFNRVFNSSLNDCKAFCQLLKKEKIYHKSTKIMQNNGADMKDLILLYVKGSKYPELYFGSMGIVKKIKPLVKVFIQEPKNYLLDLMRLGITKANYLAKFRKDRRNAFDDLNEKLPEIEKEYIHILKID